MDHSRPIFSLLLSFQYSWQYTNYCRWLVLNHGPLVSETNALPIEPQPLPLPLDLVLKWASDEASVVPNVLSSHPRRHSISLSFWSWSIRVWKRNNTWHRNQASAPWLTFGDSTVKNTKRQTVWPLTKSIILALQCDQIWWIFATLAEGK